jgi:hypothetical protein
MKETENTNRSFRMISLLAVLIMSVIFGFIISGEILIVKKESSSFLLPITILEIFLVIIPMAVFFGGFEKSRWKVAIFTLATLLLSIFWTKFFSP